MIYFTLALETKDQLETVEVLSLMNHGISSQKIKISFIQKTHNNSVLKFQIQ